MASALEWRFQPYLHNSQCEIFGDHPLPHRKHVGVVVLARQSCTLLVPAKRAPHAVHFVCGHCFAITRPTENNSTLAFTTRTCFRCRSNTNRIIDRVLAES